MAGDFDQLRQTMPNLARVDPLSEEVREWLDRAYEAVKRVDQAEAVILRMHERYLFDPAEKVVASAEIVETVDRAARTAALLRKTRLTRRPAA